MPYRSQPTPLERLHHLLLSAHLTVGTLHPDSYGDDVDPVLVRTAQLIAMQDLSDVIDAIEPAFVVCLEQLKASRPMANRCANVRPAESPLHVDGSTPMERCTLAPDHEAPECDFKRWR